MIPTMVRAPRPSLRLPAAGERVEILEPLRGLAALAVAWYHFTNSGPLLAEGSWLRASGHYGWLGVEVFFVISGFVIPLSMHRAGYRLRDDAGHFVLKRVLRLDPPYLVTIALTVALAYASTWAPGFQGQPPSFGTAQLLAHLGYLNTFLGYDWVSPVFWTLAIEFQYYLLAAVIFPLLTHERESVRLGLVVVLAASGFVVESPAYLLHFGGLFALGGATFLHATRHLSPFAFLLTVAGLTVLTAGAVGPVVAGVGAATALVIGFVRWRPWPWLTGLGTVSYSLYLLHVPFGGRVLNLGARIAGGSVALQLAVLATAVAVSLVAAWGLYATVERRSQRWSSSIRYRRGPSTPVSEPAL